jgi:hypothetical protein
VNDILDPFIEELIEKEESYMDFQYVVWTVWIDFDVCM